MAADSSQGNVSIVVTLVSEIDSLFAVDLALIVQIGTILSAATYYREDIKTALRSAPGWRLGAAYGPQHTDKRVIIPSSVATGLVASRCI